MVAVPEQRVCARANLKTKPLEPEETQYSALGITVEYLSTFPDIPDIFDSIKNGGIFLREYVHKAPQLRSRDNHEDNGNRIRETTRTFYPCHTVAETCEIFDKRPGVIRGDEPDDDVPQRDQLLDFHPEEGAKPITGEIGKQVPVIGKIREHKPGRKEPDTRLGDTNAGRQIGMPPSDINSPDGLETCFNNPCNEDEQGDCCYPENPSADSVPLPTRIIVPGILNILRNDPEAGAYENTAVWAECLSVHGC